MMKNTGQGPCGAPIQNLVEDQLAEAVLEGRVRAGRFGEAPLKGRDSLNFLPGTHKLLENRMGLVV